MLYYTTSLKIVFLEIKVVHASIRVEFGYYLDLTQFRQVIEQRIRTVSTISLDQAVLRSNWVSFS